jgi:hypothetical protein
MKWVAISIFVAACFAGSAGRRMAIAGPQEAPLHLRDTFEFTLHTPLGPAVSLFGAHGERGWAGKDWDPKFLYPQPEQDKAGAVFTADHTPWVMTAFDPGKGHVQYVIFRGDLLITLLDIQLDAIDSATTKVSVAYEWTALKPEANDHIRHMAERHRGIGKHWEAAINSYLQDQANSKK